jgi:hypothetical protein
MNSILDIASKNQKRAWKIVRDTNIIPIWESIGAEANLVGSLSTGLLMNHKDIDFHVYTPSLNILTSFSAIARIAENSSIKHIEYTNLIDTEEACIEWHLWHLDSDKELWQIDVIHILKDSFFDGHAEKLTERLLEVLTPETRYAILSLKNDTPPSEKILGVEYYQAVIEDGVRNYPDFVKWRKAHPAKGIISWIP